MTKEIRIKDCIRLDQFLKWARVVGTGGQGKTIIKSGMVKVNGRPETRRGRKLYVGDFVEVGNEHRFQVREYLED